MKIKVNVPVMLFKQSDEKNLRKNSKFELLVLTNEYNNLFEFEYDGQNEIKDFIRDKLATHFDFNGKISLMQVYCLCEPYNFKDDCINLIYLAICNFGDIKDIKNCKLNSFDVKKGESILFSGKKYKYETIQTINGNTSEYTHKIYEEDLQKNKELLILLMSYKHLIRNVKNSDLVFKFLPEHFTLVDIWEIYTKLIPTEKDKSNFRKKIIKYCEPVDEIVRNKAYRPSQVYKFNSDKTDIWL